jgi:hypothetical protein
MWMAVVLVCSGGIKEGGLCYTSMSQYMFETEQACMEEIAAGANAGLFYAPPLPGEIEEWVLTDVLCYNWYKDQEGTI